MLQRDCLWHSQFGTVTEPHRETAKYGYFCFENRVVDYAKGALTGDWSDVWGGAKD